MQDHAIVQHETGARLFTVEDAYSFEDKFFEGSEIFSASRLPSDVSPPERPGNGDK